MNGYNGVVFLTLVGFLALAALLLVPVYRFLKREEKVAEAWTEDPYRSVHPPEESPEDESSDAGGAPT